MMSAYLLALAVSLQSPAPAPDSDASDSTVQPSAEQPADEQPAEEQSAEEQPAEEQAVAPAKRGALFPFPGALVGGVAGLAMGLPGLPTSLLLMAGGTTSILVVAYQYMDWEKGVLELDVDDATEVDFDPWKSSSWEPGSSDDKFKPHPYISGTMWKWGTYAVVASIFMGFFALVCTAIGVALLAGWLVLPKE